MPIDYKTENFVDRIKELTYGEGLHAAFDPIDPSTCLGSYESLQDIEGASVSVYGLLGAPKNVWDGLEMLFPGLWLMGLWLRTNRFGKKKFQFYAIAALRGEHPDWYARSYLPWPSKERSIL